MAAVRAALADRPEPAGDAACGLAFVTPDGLAWVRHQKTATGKASNIDKVAVEFLKLTKRAGLHRAGLGFDAIRHTFRTVADDARDQPAADVIMGHVARGMRAVYVERIDDARLTAVTDRVRGWLWPKGEAGAGSPQAPDAPADRVSCNRPRARARPATRPEVTRDRPAG